MKLLQKIMLGSFMGMAMQHMIATETRPAELSIADQMEFQQLEKDITSILLGLIDPLDPSYTIVHPQHIFELLQSKVDRAFELRVSDEELRGLSLYTRITLRRQRIVSGMALIMLMNRIRYVIGSSHDHVSTLSSERKRQIVHAIAKRFDDTAEEHMTTAEIEHMLLNWVPTQPRNEC